MAALAGVPLLVEAAQAQTPGSEDDLEIQRQNLRRNREQMAKVTLPMAMEPATSFKA